MRLSRGRLQRRRRQVMKEERHGIASTLQTSRSELFPRGVCGIAISGIATRVSCVAPLLRDAQALSHVLALRKGFSGSAKARIDDRFVPLILTATTVMLDP